MSLDGPRWSFDIYWQILISSKSIFFSSCWPASKVHYSWTLMDSFSKTLAT